MKRLLFICALVFLASAAQAQTPVGLAPVPKPVFTANGIPLVNGCLFTFQAGTTTPLGTYTDSTGTVLNANPIILDANGSPANAIYLTSAAYKFQLKSAGGTNCAAGSTIWTADNVSATAFLNIPNTWSALQTFSAGIAVVGASTFTNAGVFTNTQMNEYVTSLLNGFSPAASMHVDPLYTSYFNTEALTGGLTVPVGATVINGIGVAGYADSLCDSASRTKCNASAGFFRALARGNNSAVWGVNPQAADVPGLTGHSLTGNEIDVGVYGSPAFVRGLDIILAAGQNSYGVMPANSIGIEIFTGAAGGLQWNKAISIDRGSSLNGQGLVLDGKLLTNPTSSISAAFLGYDAGGVAHQSSINGDSAGNLIMQPALGTAYSFNNSGGGIGYAPNTFAALGTPPNGNHTYCSDCTIANPCAGAGTGAFAKRLNGVWVCN